MTTELRSFPNRYAGAVYIAVDHANDDLLTDFGKATLKDRYLLDGETPQTLFARVAAWFADDQAHAQRLYDYISHLWFMPATPILSNGGTERGLPISCFLNSVGDSLDEIIGTWEENAWLASRGGGIGTYWGDVRSIGEKVGRNGKTSGVVPFIKVQDSMTLGISQGSLRRGSAACYLPINHPEIEEFIEIRRPTGGDANRKSLNIHHGVVVDDKFMLAVQAGHKYPLISPLTGEVVDMIDARSLWQRLLIARIETGEPYIIFGDTVNRERPEHQKELNLEVKQSNLCAEITLPTGRDYLGNDRTAVCCLSSLNLERYDEWKGNERFVEDVMRFLDNVIQDFIDRTETMKGFEDARYSAMRERSIGMGVMGFHSYLQSQRIPFETETAEAVNKGIFSWLRQVADKVNLKLGETRGACPDAEATGRCLRFSNTQAIAPTASISIICGGTSPGIEPIAANSFTQKTLSGSFGVRNRHLDALLDEKFEELAKDSALMKFVGCDAWKQKVWSQITADEGSVRNLTFLTDHEKAVFKTAFELDQEWIIDHAAVRAPFISQAQSVNIFLPADVHKKRLHDLHFAAWKRGVKSLYYCRSLSIQRADKVSHMAGTMPTEASRPDVIRADGTVAGGQEECEACQ
jgi:ribonucleoside-diphosphate reductase alpha chain